MANDKPINIFIVGDLVIDHTVFLREASSRHQRIADELIYEVVRRMDMAGGAANNARILAVLSQGKTFLWGLVGRSNWGSFRSILEKCHAIDEADSNVEFRGVQDETQAQMNTITRLIMVEKGGPPNYLEPVHKGRFDDYGHLHVANDKRHAVLHYLKRAQEKYRSIDGIIVNDLEMNCLTSEMIKGIAKFASEQKPPIPLFVDPKRDRKKYGEIVGTAIMPNLSEWCSLVEQKEPDAERKWRDGLSSPDSLAEMAQLSFKYLGNFLYHIISCGKDGTVLIFPHPDPRYSYKYAVYRLKPHPTKKPNRPPQLGCGDVLTAVFALEFSRSEQDSKGALRAFQIANAVVASYRDMSWHRMPTRDEIEKISATLQPLPKPLAEPSKGMLFLPKKQNVPLANYETKVPGLYSVDATFQRRVDELLNDIQNNWEPKLKSIIMGAPSGCGKSTITAALERTLGNLFGIDVADYQDIPPVDWNNLENYFKGLQQTLGARSGKLLVIVDEALKGGTGENLEKYGVIMLNAAHSYNIRFLFIGTEFTPDEKTSVNSEFTSRCRSHYLSGLAERPIDIPYIVASRVFECRPAVNFVEIEGRFLLGITNKILSTNVNPRKLCEWVDDACKNADPRNKQVSPLHINVEHLPDEARPSDAQPSELVPTSFTFHKV